MVQPVDLSGHRVLVVEDDYYLADDTAQSLRSAGATVLGPFPSLETARLELAGNGPTAAVIDINLGDGPKFDIARELSARRVPFIFVTGYDGSTIPAEFAGVPRLQKPVERGQIIGSLASVVGRGS